MNMHIVHSSYPNFTNITAICPNGLSFFQPKLFTTSLYGAFSAASKRNILEELTVTMVMNYND